jgi:hypothetical protein
VGIKTMEELEKLTETGDKEAMNALLHKKISDHPEIVYVRRMATIGIIFFIIIVGLLFWFFFSGGAKRVNDMQIDAARYALFRNPVEYQLLERNINEAILYIQETSYKYTKTHSEKLNEKQMGAYVSLLCFYNVKYNRDPYISIAITAAESEFDPTKISPMYAYGLNQIIKTTYKEVNWRMRKGSGDIMDVYNNTDAALYHQYDTERSLCEEFNIEKITVRQLACAYNGGIKRACRAMAANRYDNEVLPLETIGYMEKVFFYYTNYKKGNFKVWWYEKDYKHGEEKK